jgi:hypothetical protein
VTSIQNYLTPIKYLGNSYTPKTGRIQMLNQQYRLEGKVMSSIPTPSCTNVAGVCTCTNVVYESDYTVNLTSSSSISSISVDFFI